MRVVFIGSSRFGLRCLEATTNLSDVDIVGVITNPESFKISYSPQGVRNVLHADFSQWAAEHKVSCYTMMESMKEPALKAWLDGNKPDLLVVVGWYHMIPKFLRDVAPAVGLHASLLPDYSGGAPLVWAMINGERQTGVTLFQMGDGVDNGPIYGQAATEISSQDTIATLYSRIENLGVSLLQEYLPKIARGVALPQVQDEKKRRVFPQRCPDDGLINWGQSATKVYNFIRAQTKPYPGAFSFIQGRKVIILSCDKLPEKSPPAEHSVGAISYDEESKRVLVFTGQNNVVGLGEVLVEGIEMSAATFLLEHLHVKKLVFDA